tara:strand:+ start:279 stop:488 length:210 start_codon:yes stop_codon:yes gene_type:complete
MRKFIQLNKVNTLLHFQKGNYVYRYVLVDRYEVTKTHHNGFDDKEQMTEAEIFQLMNPRKLRRKYIHKK